MLVNDEQNYIQGRGHAPLGVTSDSRRLSRMPDERAGKADVLGVTLDDPGEDDPADLPS